MDNIYTFGAGSLQMVLESWLNRKCGPYTWSIEPSLWDTLSRGIPKNWGATGSCLSHFSKYYHEACMGMTLSYVHAYDIQSTCFQYKYKFSWAYFAILIKVLNGSLRFNWPNKPTSRVVEQQKMLESTKNRIDQTANLL